jgi:predicted nucleic acid-binding protein
MIIVDTSVWIPFFNGTPSIQMNLLKELITNRVRIAITDLILTEILQGIRHPQQFNKTKNALLQLDILHAVPVKTYIHAADLYRTGREKGFTIRKTNDCIIAAIAIENDCPVLHQDRDFEAMINFCELKVYHH